MQVSDGVVARRRSGAVLLAGAAALAGLVGGGVLPYAAFPLVTGVVLLLGAAAGPRRAALWGPGLVLVCVGMTVLAWFEAGRPLDAQFTALVLLSCGLGGTLGALLARLAPVVVTSASVALPVLGLGALLLAESQAVGPFPGDVRVYALLLAGRGLVELRP